MESPALRYKETADVELDERLLVGSAWPWDLGCGDLCGAAGCELAAGGFVDCGRYTYTGREWDDAVKMFYFRARWYEPIVGRFTGRDPLGYIDGMSLYRSYLVQTNMDPFGNLTLTVTNKKWRKKCGGFLDVIKWNPGPAEKEGYIVQKVCTKHKMEQCPNKKRRPCTPLPDWTPPFNWRTCDSNCYIEVWVVIDGVVGIDHRRLGPEHATDSFGIFDCPNTFGEYEAIGEAVFVPLDWSNANPDFDVKTKVHIKERGVKWAHSLFSACWEDEGIEAFWEKIVGQFGVSTKRRSSSVWTCCERYDCFGHTATYEGETPDK